MRLYHVPLEKLSSQCFLPFVALSLPSLHLAALDTYSNNHATGLYIHQTQLPQVLQICRQRIWLSVLILYICLEHMIPNIIQIYLTLLRMLVLLLSQLARSGKRDLTIRVMEANGRPNSASMSMVCNTERRMGARVVPLNWMLPTLLVVSFRKRLANYIVIILLYYCIIISFFTTRTTTAS